jgi:putative intracellular protease/amidase
VAVVVEHRYHELELWHAVLRFREFGAQVSIDEPARGQTYLSVLGHPVTPGDINAAVAAIYDLLVAPGGSAARRLAETDAARPLVESHPTEGHCTAGSTGGGQPVSGALWASKLAYPAVSHAKVGLGDEVILGRLADNSCRLPQLAPA